MENLDPDFYYSVQFSGDGGTTWSRTYLFKTDRMTEAESIQHSEISIQKVLRDGQVIIRRAEKSYNVLGAEVDR